jgi:hypothetical protein
MEGIRASPEGTPLSAFAETLCQRCGARTEEPIMARRVTVERCFCGGVRQVVRVVHHERGEPPNGPDRLERSVRHRSEQETRPRGRRGQR